MPKATAIFDADDSRLSGALARISGKMLALQSRFAKFAAAFIAIRAVAGMVTAGFDRFKQARVISPRSSGRCRRLRACAKRFGSPSGARGVKLPAWVARHGSKRSAAAVINTFTRFRIILTNAVKYVTNVEGYDRRIQSAINIQGRKMQRRAEFLLTRALRKAGWK